MSIFDAAIMSTFHIISLFLVLSITYVLTNRCEVAQVCVTDLSQEDCGPGLTLVRNASIFGCCPGCRQNGIDGEDSGKTIKSSFYKFDKGNIIIEKRKE